SPLILINAVERTPTAGNDTSALIVDLVGSRSQKSLRELQACRQALDELARSLESSLAADAPDIAAVVDSLTAAANARAQQLVDQASADAQRTIDALQNQLAEQSAARDKLAADLDESRSMLEASQDSARKAEAAWEKEIQARTEAEARLKKMRAALEH